MNTYTITKVSGAPDWSAIPTLEMAHAHRDRVEGIRAFTQVAYNEEALLIHQRAVEQNLRSEEVGPLAAPCKDSCLEFFFCPVEGNERYFNIECNPSCNMYVGTGAHIEDLFRLIPNGLEWDEIFGARSVRTEDGWELYYEIPYSFIRKFFPDFDPAPGKAIRANCYKCGDLTVAPHWLAWCPIVTREKLSFHWPRDFGRMIFG